MDPTVRRVIAVALLATQTGCLPALLTPPTAGYGAPYEGNGTPIYIKDSRTDWTITEGGKPITSEQALELTKDQEYETRRQIAKEHNEKLYAEGQSHRTRRTMLMVAGASIAIAGFIVAAVLPAILRTTTTMQPTASDPEMRTVAPGAASYGALAGGAIAGTIGVGVLGYGMFGGRSDPPYEPWHTPSALNRPAYVREKTEAYNEKIGAPPVDAQPGSVESIPPAPGQRNPPAPKPTLPANTAARHSTKVHR
jgi:hypothetical protein